MASESWSGFTDEDIERIKSNSTNSSLCNGKSCEGVPITQSRGPMKIKMVSNNIVGKELDLSSNLDEGNKVPKKCKDQFRPTTGKEYFKGIKSQNKSMSETVLDQIGIDDEQQPDRIVESSYSVKEMDSSSYTDSEPDVHLPPLEVFEIKQKRIEAENARRRALINKAITDKKKRTHAEAIKLAKITQELNRLDSILSADVSILRDYIEKASLEFSEAEKHYLKAEKEFVEAKLMLFEKMQRKQQLTEHLCAIIEQNENRKASKLVELMKQLEMETVMEDCEINGTDPILSNLCILNEEAYHSCQTIKSNSPRPGVITQLPEKIIQVGHIIPENDENPTKEVEVIEAEIELQKEESSNVS